VSTRQFGFGYGYTGALASDSHWLQFIERRIDSTNDAGTTAVPATVTIHSNTYALTTDNTKPNWVVDSYNPSNPFFDDTHGNESWRDATSVSTFDAPSAIDNLVKQQFAAGAKRVTSHAHFDIYLVRDFAPIFHIEVQIVWTYTAADKRTTSRQVTSMGAITSLPAAQKQALVKRYPAFAYIR
jgi:hypothetical protein